MKFLRTIRLDASDEEVYPSAARPGEWAVPGSFSFLDDTPETLAGRRLQAFRSGFLGTGSFGWCSLVEVAEMEEDEVSRVIDRLAQHFIAHHGAPHIAAALPAAADEVDYASALCEHPVHTLLTIERELGAEGIVEKLKVLRLRADDHGSVRLWGPDEG
jgi:hypothetical protein